MRDQLNIGVKLIIKPPHYANDSNEEKYEINQGSDWGFSIVCELNQSSSISARVRVK